MLTKHDQRKMPKNLGHIESLARSYTDTAIKTLAGIIMEQTSPPMARIVAAKVLLDRGWGKPKEMHHSEVDDNKTLLKVVNEIVHVYETREQIEFNEVNTGFRCANSFRVPMRRGNPATVKRGKGQCMSLSACDGRENV